MAVRSFQQKACHVLQLFSLSLTVWILAAGMCRYGIVHVAQYAHDKPMPAAS